MSIAAFEAQAREPDSGSVHAPGFDHVRGGWRGGGGTVDGERLRGGSEGKRDRRVGRAPRWAA